VAAGTTSGKHPALDLKIINFEPSNGISCLNLHCVGALSLLPECWPTYRLNIYPHIKRINGMCAASIWVHAKMLNLTLCWHKNRTGHADNGQIQ